MLVPRSTSGNYDAYVGHHELADRYLWGRMDWLGGSGPLDGPNPRRRAGDYLEETWDFFERVSLCGEGGCLEYIATMHPNLRPIAQELLDVYNEAKTGYMRLKSAFNTAPAVGHEHALEAGVPVLVEAMRKYLGLEAELFTRLSNESANKARTEGSGGQAKDGSAAADILIVEDEEDVAAALQFALEQQGFTCVVAADGPQGMIKADEFRPRVVLLDLNIPEMDGLEVCLRLKASGEHGSTAVFVVSARTSCQDTFMVHQVGADDFIPKPFDMSELIEKVRSRLV